MNYEQHLQNELKRNKKQLSQKAKSLKNNMENVIDRLEKDQGLNGLGEVQGLGLEVDLLCSKIEQIKDMLEDYQAIEGSKKGLL